MEQHRLLEAFLDKNIALDTETIVNHGVCNVAQVIQKLENKFGRDPIRRPKTKGDGYFVRVRSLNELADS